MIRVLDLETTGIPDEADRHAVVEVGYCDFDEATGAISTPVSTLVNPHRPISIGASAVHHIRDCDVADAPGVEKVFLQLGTATMFCAHNVDFEQQFFGGGDKPWLCTYKTALRIWLDAPTHSVQGLRYFLKLDDDPSFDRCRAMPPHRAAADAYVGAHILKHVLKAIDLATALRWSKGPALLYMCWLKKHKGTPWHQVPADYLDWIVNKSDITDRNIRATAKYYLTKSQSPKPDGGSP